ncbi:MULTISPECIES: aggregation-promoting factor C-terminal-like domain-containing protein [Streptomyces]|uniref:Secreted protein n=2 Tax=Streptomyces griseoaurantiacus TaxID=68213 RepID=F3NC61_9ACTN|nr:MULTISPECIES: transglycosylase SLT domain-containing protein [Streptomyces]EGG48949.1 secreted protein [Streptomyces griseoaurantiacus M045]MDX3091023.1 transglycosylase SLT domain-containing protein [Streptomyces sp. ME12-02E]MDX3334459.1 transglycosylase SLT domain-containing protein [Streptomyces sp. ME02-6978a]MDX3363520.1 transglycosylase SLT domain-containing protein [Streptomyces sp. ME02-6978.2a]WTI28615.1 lytic transglycosylase domain-containing protein [Streptomyces jietaisiensis]
MSRISVRGFAVASATAVTAVGSVVGVASGSVAQNNDAEAATADATLLSDIPVGTQAQVQTASLAQQADAQAIAADTSARKDAEAAARKAAAKSAVAKKAAAEKAANDAKERAKQKKESSRSATRDASTFSVQSSYTIAQVQAIARQIVPSGQFQCFSNIVNHESSWNYKATNPSSGAYGLVQALPAGKMASAGADWQTNPATQIKWGLNYMNQRYGSPCDAWSYWQANGNY